MKNVVIVDCARTAIGRMGGTLKKMTPVEMAGLTIKALVEKSRICEKGKVDAVFAGSAFGDVRALNFARNSALSAGLPYETSATYVEMQCGSAIASINAAALQIQDGLIETAIVGGAETYSQGYVKFSTSTEPYKGIAPAAVPFRLAALDEDNISMIEISDLLAKKWGISRQQCDEFALRSQQLAARAIENGYFEEEIVPVEIKDKKGQVVAVFNQDEHPRKDTTMESLAKLKTVYKDGVTTAGNASGRNDGAAFVLMMSEDKANELGYEPYARWITGADVGVDPKLMGIAPA